MKFLTKNNITQKIIIAIIISLLFGFTFPTYSQAGLGEILIDPIVDFVGTLFDAVIGGLQMFLVDGTANNSNSGSLTNPFLINVDEFRSGNYPEFKGGSTTATVTIDSETLSKNLLGASNFFIPALKYTPQKIFSGLIPALDANFINPKQWNNAEEESRSIAIQLREEISGWYVALRNLAIVGLMSVLLYVGIRIIISSAASEKSKYKQMLVDWLVAMCLIFCLHYIMAFTTTIVNEISSAINGAESQNGNNICVNVTGSESVTFNTDLMGVIRFKMQSNEVWLKLLYLIMYMAMVMYTCLFTFVYLKRVLTIAFLTLIAPLVAFTYPIDKLRDGKAQAFNLWLKEYVFNILIQPFHLIIFTVFVSSADQLVADNPIFAIVALAFIGPAEKILRGFFGFNDAKTGGTLSSLAGIAGGTAAFNMVSKALNKGGKSGGSQSSKGSESIKTKKGPEVNAPSLGESFGSSANNNEGTGEQNELDEDAMMRNMYFGNDEVYAPNNSPTPNYSSTSAPSYDSSATDDEEAMMNNMYLGNDEVYAPNNSTTEIPTEEDNSNQTIHQRAWQTYDNDNRDLGQYLGDAARTYGGAAVSGFKNYMAEKPLGQNAIRLKNKGEEAVDKAKQALDNRPILKNTLKGAVGVGKYVGKKALRTAGRVASAVPGAMFGMAAGIAGDDLGDIWKYTAAGAALSTAATPKIAGSIKSGASNIKNAYNEGRYGEKEAALREKRNSYIKSKDLDEEYAKKFKNEDGTELTKTQLREKKQQGAYFDSMGIEGKDSVKAVALQDKIKKELRQQDTNIGEDDANSRAQQQAATIAKLAQSYSEKV